MENECVTRGALVRVVLLLTRDTSYALSPIERELLAQFLRGAVTLDQLLWLAEERIQTVQAMDRLKKLTTDLIPLEA
jgi:hypothetical protein